MTNNENPLVAIDCMVYNAEDCIRQCLDGFVMQQTTFPFIAVVHDDASTDHTADIIREYEAIYPHIIKPIYEKKNVFSQPNGSWLLNSIVSQGCKGAKYIASCEGDDYWTDPHKLQRQVDYLEQHKDVVLVAENAEILYTDKANKQPPIPDTGQKRLFSTEPTREIAFAELLYQRRFATASVMYRAQYQEELLQLKTPVFDTLFWAYLATKGKIYYQDIVSSVYRRGGGVTESDKIRWAYMNEDFNDSLIANLHIPQPIINHRKQILAADFYAAFVQACQQKQYAAALKLWRHSLKYSSTYILKEVRKSRVKKYKNRLHNFVNKQKPWLLPLYYQLWHGRVGTLEAGGENDIAALGLQAEPLPEIIVSLTSFPPRFSNLHLCLKSLLNQTYKPNRIILWLDKDVQMKDVPWRVRRLQKYGVEIRPVCEDIKPHKKYLYAVLEFPNAAIITTDDDIVYPRHMVASLVKNYQKYPNAVSARRVHRILRDETGAPLPYNQWDWCYIGSSEPSFDLVPGGVGGVLYPSNLFQRCSPLYLNTANIQKYCLKADDFWLKFIELKYNYPVSVVPYTSILFYELKYKNDPQDLASTNVGQNQNDVYIKQCEEFFGVKL